MARRREGLLRSKNRGHKKFGVLGRFLSEYPLPVIFCVVALCAGLSTGWFLPKRIVNKKLFESLLLRPKTRLQREANRWTNRENDGYLTSNEATNARATKGGKNVLTKKNMAQVYRFWESARIPELEIDYRGVTYGAEDVLSYAGAQPYRFTVLDCFQEGAYDYRGEDLADISSSLTLLVGIADELLSPFGPRTTTVTPYSWCEYARISVAYAPSALLDPKRFGRCRQFVDEQLFRDFGNPLAQAYDFHRFMAHDVVSSEPSTSYAFGCRRPFLEEPVGRCNPAFTCCDLSKVYSTCARCQSEGVAMADCIVEDEISVYSAESGGSGGGNGTNGTSAQVSLVLSGETCEAFSDLLGTTDDWNVNPHYDASYAELDACDAFDFWPVSTVYGALFAGASPALPNSTTFEDCPDRRAAFDALDTEAKAMTATVEIFLRQFLCKLLGADSCPTTLTDVDYAWDFERTALATDLEIEATAESGRCTQWDGGPEGLGLFDYLQTDIVLGPSGKAVQTVQVSNGFLTIKDGIRAKQPKRVRKNEAERARTAFLDKYAKRLHGRYRKQSMLFGTYLSSAAELAIERSSVPEVPLITMAYLFILLYTTGILGLAASGPSSLKTAALHVALAFFGLVLVLIGLVGGVGFVLFFGNDFNAVSVQVLPFVLLGLGINDLFVVSYCYLRDLRKLLFLVLQQRASDPVDDRRAAGDLVSVVAVDAGATITLTTTANAFVFAVAGAFVKMRLVSTFCFLALGGLVGTWFCTVLAYPALLSLHARAALAITRAEYRAAGKLNTDDDDGDDDDDDGKEKDAPSEAKAAEKIQSSTSSSGPEDDAEAKKHLASKSGRRTQFVEYYASALTTKLTTRWTALLVCVAAVIAITVVGIPQVRLDFPIFSMFPRNSSPATFWATKRMHLPVNFFEVKTDQLDWPRKHPLYASYADPLRYSLIQQVEAAKKTDSRQSIWYTVFVQWLLPCGTGSFADVGMDQSQVRQACLDSPFYGPVARSLNAYADNPNNDLYNPRCSDTDALMTPGFFCGPRATNFTTLSPEEHVLASRKAQEFATQDPTAPTALAQPGIPACSAWPVQYLRCDGQECFGRAELSDGLYEAIQRNETSVLALHPTYFYDCLNYFLKADNANTFRSPNFNCVTPGKPSEYRPCRSLSPTERNVWRGESGRGDMDHTSATIWSQNLKEGKNWLKLFSSIRRKINRFVSTTDFFAYPGSDFLIFWYQYRFIEKVLTQAMITSVCGIFAISFAFFAFARAPTDTDTEGSVVWKRRLYEAAAVALYMTVGVVLFVLTFIGLMGITDLWFNAFTLASVIISLGLAVEFVAHTSTGFLVTVGTSAERARAAASAYVLPIFDGAFTTFLGVAPLAGSVLIYINLYYFRLYSIIVAVGIVFGVFFYPALLATLGPDNSGAAKGLFVTQLLSKGSSKSDDGSHIELSTAVTLDDDKAKDTLVSVASSTSIPDEGKGVDVIDEERTVASADV